MTSSREGMKYFVGLMMSTRLKLKTISKTFIPYLVGFMVFSVSPVFASDTFQDREETCRQIDKESHPGEFKNAKIKCFRDLGIDTYRELNATKGELNRTNDQSIVIIARKPGKRSVYIKDASLVREVPPKQFPNPTSETLRCTGEFVSPENPFRGHVCKVKMSPADYVNDEFEGRFRKCEQINLNTHPKPKIAKIKCFRDLTRDTYKELNATKDELNRTNDQPVVVYDRIYPTSIMTDEIAPKQNGNPSSETLRCTPSVRVAPVDGRVCLVKMPPRVRVIQ